MCLHFIYSALFAHIFPPVNSNYFKHKVVLEVNDSGFKVEWIRCDLVLFVDAAELPLFPGFLKSRNKSARRKATKRANPNTAASPPKNQYPLQIEAKKF